MVGTLGKKVISSNPAKRFINSSSSKRGTRIWVAQLNRAQPMDTTRPYTWKYGSTDRTERLSMGM